MTAKIRTAEANQRESRAKVDKAAADVRVAEAHLRVAIADRDRVLALTEYTKIRAPFNGVVSERHVDPVHFLQPGMSGGANKTDPLFIVVDTKKVRVFVEVPDTDAIWIKDGAKVKIRVQALNDRDFEGTVNGSSFALDPVQRTLRAEIDLNNTDKRELRPGMYAYARIPLYRSNVLTIPAAAILTRDGETFCFCAENGKAIRTPIKIGFRQGPVVEVVQKLCGSEDGENRWGPFTGSEKIILTEPAKLIDGQAIVESD